MRHAANALSIPQCAILMNSNIPQVKRTTVARRLAEIITIHCLIFHVPLKDLKRDAE